jgi:hypothetical protein
MLIVWLVGHHLLLRDYGPCRILFYECEYCYNRFIVWLSFVVTGFWALRHNIIIVDILTLLKDAYYVPILLYNAAQLLYPPYEIVLNLIRLWSSVKQS